MRAPKVLLAAGIATSTYAAALEAPVYIFDRDAYSRPGSPPAAAVEPSAARLLLAHRLGLSQYHILGDADDFGLQLLNRFGGANPSLFTQDEKADHRDRLLVVVEGVEKPDRMIQLYFLVLICQRLTICTEFFDDTQTPSFTISNPPSSSSNLELTTNLLTQDGHRRRASRSCTSIQSTQFAAVLLNGGFNGIDVSPIFRILEHAWLTGFPGSWKMHSIIYHAIGRKGRCNRAWS